MSIGSLFKFCLKIVKFYISYKYLKVIPLDPFIDTFQYFKRWTVGLGAIRNSTLPH